MEFLIVQYKKLLSILILLASLVLGIVVFEVLAFTEFTTFTKALISKVEGVFAPPVESTSSDIVPEETLPTVFSEQLQPLYAKPVRLQIDRLNIDVDVEEVGVDATGKMDTPEQWINAGWYKKSAMPGEVGNVIINGHYDNNTGAPAAFWQLKNAQVNDKVSVVDNYGKSFPYVIAELFYVDIQDPERLKIFDEGTDNSELTLVTCGGIWIPGSGYSKRLVVKAYLDTSN